MGLMITRLCSGRGAVRGTGGGTRTHHQSSPSKRALDVVMRAGLLLLLVHAFWGTRCIRGDGILEMDIYSLQSKSVMTNRRIDDLETRVARSEIEQIDDSERRRRLDARVAVLETDNSDRLVSEVDDLRRLREAEARVAVLERELADLKRVVGTLSKENEGHLRFESSLEAPPANSPGRAAVVSISRAGPDRDSAVVTPVR